MMKKKINEFKITKNVDQTPYEQKNTITPLKVMVVIVNHGQGEYFLKGFSNLEVSCSFMLYGRGTAPVEFQDIIGIGGARKDIILGIVKEPDMYKVRKLIKERFKVSEKAKGIAFSMKIDSMIGVVLYKFLTNTRVYQRRSK